MRNYRVYQSELVETKWGIVGSFLVGKLDTTGFWASLFRRSCKISAFIRLLGTGLLLPDFSTPFSLDIKLHIESKFYRIMQGGVGIPTIKWCRSEGDFNVMELLGPSLEDFFNFCSRKFSLKTVLLADQLISRIEFIHSKNFIHRDIKPDNLKKIVT